MHFLFTCHPVGWVGASAGRDARDLIRSARQGHASLVLPQLADHCATFSGVEIGQQWPFSLCNVALLKLLRVLLLRLCIIAVGGLIACTQGQQSRKQPACRKPITPI